MRTFTYRLRQTRSSRRALFETLENRSLMAVISHWTGDNTALDSVSGNNGTLYNGATYAAGQVGQAFSFDGVNDRINVADSPSFKLTQSLSIEAWVKVQSIGTSNGVIFARADDRGGMDPYALAVFSDGRLVFNIDNPTTRVTVATPAPLGEFIHVVGTLDDASGAMRLYVNGVQMANRITTVRPFADLDSASNPGIGIGNHGGYPTTPHNFPFHGLIDELKLYDHALTSEEVLANFNATKGDLQPKISISDATATEGATSYRFRDSFVNTQDSGLDFPRSMVFHDGDLFVANVNTNSVHRYDGDTGSFLGEFVSSGSGGLNGPFDLAFGPDGHLYVTSFGGTYTVNRYNGTTGAFLNVFVSADSGGLTDPTGLAFDANGDLFVSSYTGGQVLKYQGPNNSSPGSFVGVFANTGTGSSPDHIVFGPDGSLYVGATGHLTPTPFDAAILRYNGVTGAPLGIYIPTGRGGLQDVRQMVFNANGNLLLADPAQNAVLIYQGPGDTNPGAYVGQAVSPGLGGLNVPLGIALGPDSRLYVSSRESDLVLRYEPNAAAVFTVSLSSPSNSLVTVNYATANGTASAGSDFTTALGTITFEPGQTSRTILVQTVDNLAAEPNETFNIILTSGQGVVIADGTGLGRIIDDDTKFYVVDDASINRTFEYGVSGPTIEDYALTVGNTAPRGAASTAAGDKVWVVDNNRNVYVYSPSGAPLGSWSVGGFNTSAQFEGIAVSGNDVWIVDNKSDKVYRFNGAANLLANPPGKSSVTSSSNFALNSANKDASDLVTDGTSIWVLNNTSSIDKVFKYNAANGALIGSWTITGGGGSPTGITIDPSLSPTDPNRSIWIVDNNTDRVYQFDNAAGIAGGSLSPNSSFALAAGNTNPQGIADPPAPSANEPTAARIDSANNFAFDSALLAFVGELDGLLTNRKKRQ